MSTLAERLKFESGLTVGTHAITLQKGEQRIAALVTIGRAGSAPRLQVLGKTYLTTYRVVGDDLLPVGDSAAYVYADQFREATSNPIANILT
jgi:hypothetical protein